MPKSFIILLNHGTFFHKKRFARGRDPTTTLHTPNANNLNKDQMMKTDKNVK